MLNPLIRWVATGGGVGLIPKLPGTAGSVVGVGLWWVLTRCGAVWMWGGEVVLIAGAVWVAGAAAKQMNHPDPACVVIDEIVAVPIALAGIEPAWHSIGIGFVAFRVFDIWKPFPVCQAQKLPGGLGIVVDDLLAGIYACVVTHALVRLVS